MGLRERAAQIAGSYDASKDEINGYEGLPAGDYQMIVVNAQRSNLDQLSIRAEVLDGSENDGRVEFINLGLDEVTQSGKPLPDFVIDRNIKTIMRLGLVLGIAVTDEAWDDVGVLVKEFEPAVGKQFMMHLTLKENKNNPSYPYKEYEFDAVEQDPNDLNGVEVDDNDLPDALSGTPAPDVNGDTPF